MNAEYPSDDSPEEPKSHENELLKRVAKEDKEAFRQIYHLFAGELNRYVFLFTRSKEDTEEIVQDLFVKLWEKRQMLPAIISFRAYLYRMARNRVLNYFRAAKVRIRTETLSDREVQQSCGADTADKLLYKQYYKLARQAIDLLPSRRKEVFLLSMNEGLSQQEIANQLSVSKSAVKQHLYIAGRFIREHLQKHGVPVMALLIFRFLFG